MATLAAPPEKRRLLRLQWQLARTFVLTAVGATLALVLLGWALIVVVFFTSPFFPIAVAVDARERIAIPAAMRLAAADTPALTAYLRRVSGEMSGPGGPRKRQPDCFSFSVGLDPQRGHRLLLAITDARGRVRAEHLRGVEGEHFRAPHIGQPLQESLSAEESALLVAALHGESDEEKLALRGADQSAVAACPLIDGQGRVIGAFFVRLYVPFHLLSVTGGLMQVALPAVTGVLGMALVPGALGGWIAARAITRRLSAIAGATEAWGRGDLARRAPEASGDELGLFARQLNRMRDELEETLKLRQEVATLQERHRLARDLHDTVKQEVFALTMQLSAMRSLLEAEGNAAERQAVMRRRLVDLEQLSGQVQRELTSVICELAPTHPTTIPPPPLPGAGKVPGAAVGFADMLRSLAANWSRNSGIATQCRETGTVLPPLPAGVRVELLRIAREALANVERHSGASAVGVTVHGCVTPGQAEMTIYDNGRGFVPEELEGFSGSGMGLRNLRERAESLPGGSLRLRSAPGEGTLVMITFATKEGV